MAISSSCFCATLEVLDAVGEVGRRPDLGEHRPHRGALIRSAPSEDPARDRDTDVLLDRHVGQDRRVLMHDGDAEDGCQRRVQGCD